MVKKDRAPKRVLLKLSGESFKGSVGYGIDTDSVDYIASQIATVSRTGVELGIVVGGGNIWRGAEAEALGMERATADHSGMLATVINSLALQDSLERRHGIPTRTQTAISIQEVAEPYIRRKAIRHLEKGRVVLFAAGIGNPYMTTDTAASLRAVEIDASALLMAKYAVDGVYEKDPNIDPSALKFECLNYEDALNKRLEVMDTTALSLCMENKMPIIVFDMFVSGNLEKIIKGERIGSLIAESCTGPLL